MSRKSQRSACQGIVQTTALWKFATRRTSSKISSFEISKSIHFRSSFWTEKAKWRALDKFIIVFNLCRCKIWKDKIWAAKRKNSIQANKIQNSKFTKVGSRIIKGSPDPSHFIFEINLGKSRIRHTTTLKLNDEFPRRLQIDLRSRYLIKFRVVLCRIRHLPTLISKIK